MKIKQTIFLKLQQKLALTPSLQQTIRLLQLTRTELEEEIINELEKNPLLEDSSLSLDNEYDTPSPEEVENIEVDSLNYFEDKIDVESYYYDFIETSEKYKGVSYEKVEEGGIEENLLTKSESLAEHLIWQIRMVNLSEEEERIAEYIIGNLREDGYLDEELENIAKDLNCDYPLCEKVLKIIQRLDPVGVASRNLKECLLIQLEVFYPEEKLPLIIVENYLEKLVNIDLEELSKELNADVEEVKKAIKVIKSLDPKPGLRFDKTINYEIVPDVIVEKVGKDYIVRLNDDGLPKLKLNRYYRLLIEKGGLKSSEETLIFLKEKLKSAFSFLKSLEERNRTIYNIACELVEYQKEFLEKGPSYIKPLILKDIAEKVGVHESTVSRVVSNKYIQTPRGIMLMKEFFSTGVQTLNGKDISQAKVKAIIKKLIEEESPQKPLTDSQIATILKREGILLARRTVAKYREEMNIPPSSARINRNYLKEKEEK